MHRPLVILALLLALVLPTVSRAQTASRETVQGLIGNAVYANQRAGKWLDGTSHADDADPADRLRQAILKHVGAAGELRTAHGLAVTNPGYGLGGFYNATVRAHLDMNAKLRAAVAAQAGTLGDDAVARATARLAKALSSIADRRGVPFVLP